MSIDYVIQFSVTVRVTDGQRAERAQLATEEATPLDATLRKPAFDDDAGAVVALFLGEALSPALEDAVRHIPGGRFVGWHAAANPITNQAPTDRNDNDTGA